MLRILLSFIVSIGVMGVELGGASAATLEDVRKRGWLQCGVQQGQPGFSVADQDGNRTGLNVDFCRAVAAAIFGDGSNVKFSDLSAAEGIGALKSGDVDILSLGSSWTMRDDTARGVHFPVITFFDGQGFLVPKEMAISSTLELSGASMCLLSSETTKSNVADYFGSNKMEFVLVEFDTVGEAVSAYEDGRCNVYTTRSSALEAQRLKLTDPDAHVVLPESISKEPLGPIVRGGDEQWLNIIRWIHFAMLNAEELGVTQANVDEMKTVGNPPVNRLLGSDAAFGGAIGLGSDWAYNVIKEVGNYGETFNRNVGPETALALTRGRNALWVDGGLHYGPPIR